MSKQNNNWYQDPLLIAAVQFEQVDDESFLAPKILDDAKFNTEQLLHVFGKEVIGLYQKERDEECVRRYINMAPDRNIILYSNAHIVSKPTYEEHKDWAQITPDGIAAPGYTNEIMICMNSPWRDYFFDRVREMLELPIKGLFLDGPLFIGTGCFCPHCRALFEEMYGHSMDEGTRTEIRNFKAKHVARFIKDVRAIIHETRPEVVLYANSHGLSENVTGCDVDEIYEHVDLLGTEGGFMFYGDPNSVSIYKCSNAARYMESKAYGKPYVIFCAANHQPWARYMMTPDENELLAAATVANGANLWYGIHGSIHDFETPSGKAGLNIIRKLADHSDCYINTTRHSDIAVMWSKESIHAFPEIVDETDFTVKERHAGSQFGSTQKEFDGACEILARNHVQFSIIDEANVRRDDLSVYQAIVLPNAVCLDDAAAESLCHYVENGGSIISTLCTGMCDENGMSRECSILAPVFGIESFKFDNYPAGHGYMTIDDEKMASALLCNPTAGFAGPLLRAEFNSDCKIIGSLHEPLPGRYSMFRKENYPAIVEHSFGKGKCIYIAGGMCANFAQFGVADYKTLLNEIIASTIKPTITVDGAYETIEVVVRKQDTRTLVHFVNYTGVMRRPIEHVISCNNIKSEIKVDHPVHRVYSMFTGEDLSYSVNGDSITVTCDVHGIYEVIVIE